MQTADRGLQNAVPPQDMGVATSSATFFRQMGGTLGTAVFLSLLFNALPDKIAGASAARGDPGVPVRGHDPAVLPTRRTSRCSRPSRRCRRGASQALNDSSFINHLDPTCSPTPFLVGFSDADGPRVPPRSVRRRGGVRHRVVPAGGEAAHPVGHAQARESAPGDRRRCGTGRHGGPARPWRASRPLPVPVSLRSEAAAPRAVPVTE